MAAGPGESADPAPAAAKAPKRRRFVRRHWILTSVAVALLLVIGSASAYLYWADHQLGDIPRVDAGITDNPDKNHHEGDQPLNILLLGADHGAKGNQTVAEDLADGEWTPGQHLSDTIIVLHIAADRDSASMMSIPRDSWVKVDGATSASGKAKINSAFEDGGPTLAVDTVEAFTGITIDHLAVIDWDGFKNLTTAIGGVRVYIPVAFYDSSQHKQWDQGWQTLEGDEALQYVRTRYDIPGDRTDDYGRIARQQNFMRALMGQLLSSDTTHNPIKFSKVLNSVASYLTVDNTWDNDEIRDLAWSMRSVKTGDVDFLTAPLGSYETIGAEAVSHVDMPQFREMISAVLDDDVNSYLNKYPDARLGDDESVN